MINKVYRNIHNKYSTLFKFIFFLRYLFGIFFISIVLFLSIPNLFDHEKKGVIIKQYLLDSYNIKLNKYESIKFNSLPTPNLEIINASINFNSKKFKMRAQKLIIYPRLLNIYNYENFRAKKIVLEKSEAFLQSDEISILSKFIYDLKNKLRFNNLELKILKENKPILKIKKINFSNYGYGKNIINGNVFEKNFKIKMSNNFEKIKFKLLKAGISFEIDLEKIEKNIPLSGVIKIKVLNSNLKFSFKHDDKKFMIYNSYFRNKDLSFNNTSEVIYHPFFNINSNYFIDELNLEFLRDLNLEKILNSKDIIKKINSQNVINYKSKKFNRNFIDNFNLKANLSYGRLFYLKTIFISDNIFSCDGHTNLLEEYPILSFNCFIKSNDKKNLLKKFSIKYENKDEKFNLNFVGNLNILNNKINFKSIQLGEVYKAEKEDLIYFKEAFENILFDKGFLNIFNSNKIKEFILEIS